MALEPTAFDGLKITFYNFNNLDSSNATSGYYFQIGNIKSTIGASKIYAATISYWGGNIAGGKPFSIAYNDTSDVLYIMFTSGNVFTGASVKVMFLCE